MANRVYQDFLDSEKGIGFCGQVIEKANLTLSYQVITDLSSTFEKCIFSSHLTTFEGSAIFSADHAIRKNWLEPKTKPFNQEYTPMYFSIEMINFQVQHFGSYVHDFESSQRERGVCCVVVHLQNVSRIWTSLTRLRPQPTSENGIRFISDQK